ncbi:hypothetical protein F511_35031 [Dorcoceras hygrometricum]|uniref:Uncharacterized protein n=1 Tax=Dorcoceras hygrometricum TaxID=472368 RepID=A0A2Z7CZD3_9LAMI|nr:hypothetical protein F511_35031 [Dorcoceras hygrometricum]
MHRQDKGCTQRPSGRAHAVCATGAQRPPRHVRMMRAPACTIRPQCARCRLCGAWHNIMLAAQLALAKQITLTGTSLAKDIFISANPQDDTFYRLVDTLSLYEELDISSTQIIGKFRANLERSSGLFRKLIGSLLNCDLALQALI